MSIGTGMSIKIEEDDKGFLAEIRRMNISFTRENVVLLTKSYVPMYVMFTASLGTKFIAINLCIKGKLADVREVSTFCTTILYVYCHRVALDPNFTMSNFLFGKIFFCINPLYWSMHIITVQ